MVITQHIPGCAQDLRDPTVHVEFETLEQLLAVDFVARAALKEDFVKFSLGGVVGVNKGENDPTYYVELLQELEDRYSCWVIGTIKGSIKQILSLGLPAFLPKVPVGSTRH